MNKKMKTALAAVVILAAGATSISAFAASDNARYNSDNPNNQAWEQSRKNHLDEQVQLGNLTQEEADDMNQWMNDGSGSCHGDNQQSMNRMHNNMRGSHRRMMGN